MGDDQFLAIGEAAELVVILFTRSVLVVVLRVAPVPPPLGLQDARSVVLVLKVGIGLPKGPEYPI